MKTVTLGLLEHMREEERRFVVGLSRSDREDAREMLAHVAEFKDQQVQRVAAAAAGVAPPSFEAAQGVETPLDEIGQALIQGVVGLSEGDLADPHRFPWLEGRPFVRQILGRGLWHPLTHLVEFHRTRHREEPVRELQERLVARVEELGFVPATGDSMSSYDVACLYAATGDPARALAVLGEAVERDPEYRDHAAADPDFAALRDRPAFEALLGSKQPVAPALSPGAARSRRSAPPS